MHSLQPQPNRFNPSGSQASQLSRDSSWLWFAYGLGAAARRPPADSGAFQLAISHPQEAAPLKRDTARSELLEVLAPRRLGVYFGAGSQFCIRMTGSNFSRFGHMFTRIRFHVLTYGVIASSAQDARGGTLNRGCGVPASNWALVLTGVAIRVQSSDSCALAVYTALRNNEFSLPTMIFRKTLLLQPSLPVQKYRVRLWPFWYRSRREKAPAVRSVIPNIPRPRRLEGPWRSGQEGRIGRNVDGH